MSYTRLLQLQFGLYPIAISLIVRFREIGAGGGGWIRTIVGVSQQIYSLPPLATRAPLRSEWQIMRVENDFVKYFPFLTRNFFRCVAEPGVVGREPSDSTFPAPGLPAA